MPGRTGVSVRFTASGAKGDYRDEGVGRGYELEGSTFVRASAPFTQDNRAHRHSMTLKFHKFLFAAFFAVALVFNVNAQTSDEDLATEMSATYPFHKMLPLSKTKKNYALTVLYKSETDKASVMYAAEVNAEKDGASVSFRVYRQCEPTDLKSRLPVQIIVVSGQKIEAYAVCGKEPSGETSDIFLIKSAAGKDFVKKEFAEKGLVFVRMNGLPVPFDTQGFGQALAAASGKAL